VRRFDVLFTALILRTSSGFVMTINTPGLNVNVVVNLDTCLRRFYVFLKITF